MIDDPEFRGDAAKMNFKLTLRKGEELQEIARHLMATPKNIVERVQTLTK